MRFLKPVTKWKPKLSDLPMGIIVCACHFAGGDKPHPYPFDDTSFVVAGFIPAS